MSASKCACASCDHYTIPRSDIAAKAMVLGMGSCNATPPVGGGSQPSMSQAARLATPAAAGTATKGWSDLPAPVQRDIVLLALMGDFREIGPGMMVPGGETVANWLRLSLVNKCVRFASP